MFIFLLAVCIIWVVLWLSLAIYCWKDSNHLKPPSFDAVIGLGFICLLLAISIVISFSILFGVGYLFIIGILHFI